MIIKVVRHSKIIFLIGGELYGEENQTSFRGVFEEVDKYSTKTNMADLMLILLILSHQEVSTLLFSE